MRLDLPVEHNVHPDLKMIFYLKWAYKKQDRSPPCGKNVTEGKNAPTVNSVVLLQV